ncbi:MAG: Gfo/Idh/MocA family oxidoreductase [Treponema sp.]|nr:Gfo/Idh/MocA family oxidoreductase [Treponema sp.]
MEKLKLGVLGCSKHFAMRVSLALKSSDLIRPYAIASRDREKGSAFAASHGFSKVYDSYDALLKDPDVDFVYIPLPNNLHFEYIKKAADAGKPVLCEKPICLNAEQAKEAAEYCQKKNVPIMEAFMYRFHPQWVRAKELAAIGEIGNLQTVHTHFSYMNKDAGNIRNKADLGGGAIYDIGCYAISAARHLFGCEPARAICTMIRDPDFKTDIYVSGILDFGNGRTSTFTASTQMLPFQRVTAIGTTGFISIEVPFNMFADVPGKITVRTGVGERIIESKIADQYLLQFNAFAKSIIEKTETPSAITDAIANMAVIDAIYRSGVSGKWEDV